MQFLDCVTIVLTREGGFVHNPKDPGGATNFGITLNTLSDWRGRRVTIDEVREMTIGEARDIYKVNYWDATQCDLIPSGLNLCVFDCAVNQGVKEAILFLQWAVGVAEDGAMGPITIATIQKNFAATPKSLINAYLDRRLHHYQSSHNWSVFGKGWQNRLVQIAQAIHSDWKPK